MWVREQLQGVVASRFRGATIPWNLAALFGCGAVGSFVAQGVAALAMRPDGPRMSIYLSDDDEVGPENLGNQNFSFQDLGVNKAKALAARFSPVMELCSGSSMARTNSDKNTMYSLVGTDDAPRIAFVQTDSLRSRSIITFRLKEIAYEYGPPSHPFYIVDTRVGWKTIELHTLDMGNDKAWEGYSKSFNVPEDKVEQGRCGMAMSPATAMAAAGMAVHASLTLKPKEPYQLRIVDLDTVGAFM